MRHRRLYLQHSPQEMLFATMATITQFNFIPERALFTTNSGESWAVIECVLDETISSKEYTEVVNHDGSKVFRIPYSFPLPDRF